jgi:hypothetical protein
MGADGIGCNGQSTSSLLRCDQHGFCKRTGLVPPNCVVHRAHGLYN